MFEQILLFDLLAETVGDEQLLLLFFDPLLCVGGLVLVRVAITAFDALLIEDKVLYFLPLCLALLFLLEQFELLVGCQSVFKELSLLTIEDVILRLTLERDLL